MDAGTESKGVLVGVAGVLSVVLLLAVLLGGLHVYPQACGPQVVISHGFDPDTGELVLRHDGGDRFDPNGRTVVSITDAETGRVGTALWVTDDSDPTLEAGDDLGVGRDRAPAAIPFDLGRGDHVRVLWLYPEGVPPRESCDRPRVLAAFTVGADAAGTDDPAAQRRPRDGNRGHRRPGVQPPDRGPPRRFSPLPNA